jgi:hypothetical protein
MTLLQLESVPLADVMEACTSLVWVAAAAKRQVRAACSLRSQSDFKLSFVHRFSINSGIAMTIAIAVIEAITEVTLLGLLT